MWAWAVWEGCLEEMGLISENSASSSLLLFWVPGPLHSSKRPSSPAHPHCHLEMPHFSCFSFLIPMCLAQHGPSAIGRQVVKPGLGAVRVGRGEARPGG